MLNVLTDLGLPPTPVDSYAAASRACRDRIEAKRYAQGDWDGGTLRLGSFYHGSVQFDGCVYDANDNLLYDPLA